MSFAQPFANYEILDRIGAGSMGTVFKARQKHMDRIVALKVLKPALARNARYVERLKREARIVGQLSHPNIVTGYDLGEEGGYHFFVMEFVEARSMRQLLAEWGSFPQEQVLDVATQVAEALDHAWQRGVIHRDVKPGNILITDDGRVKLTDMGLAKGATDLTLTRHGSTVGTPQYISPEQARDPISVDVRSDLYSLGATLFHMATGQPPFRGETIGELITKVLDERAPSVTELNPDLSVGLSLVIRKLLAKDPALRYQTPRELLEDLDRVRRSERPRVDVSVLAREGRRSAVGWRRWSPWLVGGFAVAVLTVAAWTWAASNDENDTSADEVAGYRRSVLEALAATAERGYPERFARLHEFRVRTEDRERLAILADEERRLAREIEARVDALCDRYLGERRDETERWLADPENWTDADGFVRSVAVPGIRELTGYSPGMLPDPGLRAAVVARLDALRAEIEPSCAARDAAYARRYEQYLREDVTAPVRDRIEAQDFAAAELDLRERVDGFHGREHRPAAEKLSPELREQLGAREAAVVAALESSIRGARTTAAARLTRDADARLVVVERLRDDVRQRGVAPGVMREALERAERDLRRHHPAREAFVGSAVDPWPLLESRLRALGAELAELERSFDEGVLDGLLALGYQVFADGGPSQAVRVVASARPLVSTVESRRAAHAAAFECAARFRSELLASLLGDAEEEVRVAGYVVRRGASGPEVVPVGRERPLGVSMVDLEPLLAGASDEFRAAVAEDRALREGRSFWMFARGEPAAAQALLTDASLGFFVEEVWPRLRAVGDGRPSDAAAVAAFARIQEARERGDCRATGELLEEFAQRYGDTAIGLGSVAARSSLAEWARVEARRQALVEKLSQQVSPGMSVDVADDGTATITGTAADRTLESLPLDWVIQDGRMVFDAGFLDAASARARRLEFAAPFPSEGKTGLRVEVSFPRAGAEPRVVVLELQGFALVLCALPTGALAASLVLADEAFEPGVLEAALAQPILAAITPPVVVPDAFMTISLEVERRRNRDAVVRASLPGQGGAELLSVTRSGPETVEEVVRVGGLQGFAVRGIVLEGRLQE